MKSVDIKGKDYVMVNERIKYFRENYKDWSLETEIIELTEERAVFKAIIKDDKCRIIATGLAYENQSSGFINKTSYIENCETSAWGRALGNMAIGIDASMASADEVSNAIGQQEILKKPINKSQLDTLKSLIEKQDRVTQDDILIKFKINKIENMTMEQWNKSIKRLKQMEEK